MSQFCVAEQPPCHRCSAHFDDHEPVRLHTCAGYVWPGSFTAAWIDMDRAWSDLWREITAPLQRLVDLLTRRRS